jgi:hypothetical protein
VVISEYVLQWFSEMACYSLSRDVKTLIVEMLQAARATSSNDNWCLTFGRWWISWCKWMIAWSKSSGLHSAVLSVEDGATEQVHGLKHCFAVYKKQQNAMHSHTNQRKATCLQPFRTDYSANKQVTVSFWNAIAVEDLNAGQLCVV